MGPIEANFHSLGFVPNSASRCASNFKAMFFFRTQFASVKVDATMIRGVIKQDTRKVSRSSRGTPPFNILQQNPISPEPGSTGFSSAIPVLFRTKKAEML